MLDDLLAALFSVPDDSARIVALAAAAAVLLLLGRRPPAEGRTGAAFTVVASLAAAALSAGYVTCYLHGGPRIIDATSYWLEARALSEGLPAWPLGEPEHAVLGRFLLRTEVAGAPAVAVIFPPGYPALLALGFLAGAPLAVGPLIAAALVPATMALTRRVCRAAPADSWLGRAGEPAARCAAVASVACAALRYHTADTMSHGLAALCFTVGLLAAFDVCAERSGPGLRGRLPAAAVAGLATGWLLATRPISALALLATQLWLLAASRRGLAAGSRRGWLAAAGAFAAAALPGALLWLWYQHAATGSPWGIAQQSYYALSDGPPGCFRWGFGQGVGCLGEHGTFVRHNLPDGYFGLYEALGTTGRRLKMHWHDTLNHPLLGLLVPAGVWVGRHARGVRILTAALAAQLVCYAPFYFDGNYPGGGARLLADVLPLEHVLCALAVTCPAVSVRLSLARAPALLGAACLAGFAVSAGVQHRLLAEREGGRPFFEPELLAAAGIRRGLVLLDTDHGFNLAFDPQGAGSALSFARYHGDGLDRLTWEARGRPAAFRYRFSWPAGGRATVQLEPLTFDPRPTGELDLTIEGESLWPPAAQQGGWVWPGFSAAACVSRGRWLALHPAGQLASVSLRLPAAELRGRTLTPRIFRENYAGPGADGSVWLELQGEDEGRPLHRWQVPAAGAAGCLQLAPAEVPADASQLWVQVRSPVPVMLDSLICSKKR